MIVSIVFSFLLRIIVSGDDIPCAVSYVPPPGIYNITEEYGLTEQEVKGI